MPQNTPYSNFSGRLVSLDFFRGLTVASMILVNNPGDWGHIYPPFEHSKWNGCTPTDLVFPFFLFIVGVSINYAIGDKKLDPSLHKKVILKAARRSLLLFGLALLLSLIMTSFDFAHLRIMGVLQRIAIVFFICAVLFIKTSQRVQLWIFSLILVVYWLLMCFVPVPGIGPSNLEPGTNLAAWVDNLILGTNHMWRQSRTWDPEGLLSTLPAISTCLFGIAAGGILKRKDLDANKVSWLFSIAFIAILAGLIWNIFFPMNKALWTSSFVLYTGGLATAFLALSFWLIDSQGRRKYTKPFIAFGANAITIFVVSGYLPILLNNIKIATSRGRVGVTEFLYQTLLTPYLSPENASLASAVIYVFLLSFPMMWLYKKKIFIKL